MSWRRIYWCRKDLWRDEEERCSGQLDWRKCNCRNEPERLLIGKRLVCKEERLPWGHCSVFVNRLHASSLRAKTLYYLERNILFSNLCVLGSTFVILTTSTWWSLHIILRLHFFLRPQFHQCDEWRATKGITLEWYLLSHILWITCH